jgi:hypothetical protein
MSSELRRFYWLLLLPVIALAAFFGARALQPESRASFDYDRDAPAYEVVAPEPGRSKAGFSGFDPGEAIDGETLLAGRVTSVGSDTIAVELTEGRTVSLRITGDSPLDRIEPSTIGALRPGMTVVVRTNDMGDQAGGVLVLASP